MASAAATLSRCRAGAETRADLICSARELFSRHGYQGTTFKQVADRAGVTRSAVNYHFPTKRALYQTVMEASCAAVVTPAVREAVKERTLAQQVSVFIDVTGRAAAQDRLAAAFLCTSAAECATWPDLRDPEHDPLATVRAFLTRAVRAAEQRGELRGTDLGPLVELLVAMLCGIWFYVGFLGTEHGRAITSTIRQLLTGRLPTRIPTVSAGVAAGATRTGASSTTTAATSVLVRVAGDTWIGQ